MDIRDRPLAITDTETTGLDPQFHEIIDIGVVLINQKTLEVIDQFAMKVAPLYPERITESALKINGYNKEDWQNALSLESAMRSFGAMTRDAIFCAQNVTFDWSFISEGFKKSGIKNEMDYHRIDLFTAAYMKLGHLGLPKFGQDAVAKHLGIEPEPLPHRAINGALTAYKIYKKLMEVQ